MGTLIEADEVADLDARLGDEVPCAWHECKAEGRWGVRVTCCNDRWTLCQVHMDLFVHHMHHATGLVCLACGASCDALNMRSFVRWWPL